MIGWTYEKTERYCGIHIFEPLLVIRENGQVVCWEENPEPWDWLEMHQEAERRTIFAKETKVEQNAA